MFLMKNQSTTHRKSYNSFMFVLSVYETDGAIFSSTVRSTGSELMSSPVHRSRRPMLTFAFRSNVDKLLGPG